MSLQYFIPCVNFINRICSGYQNKSKLVSDADKAMYDAKKAGKNCIHISSHCTPGRLPMNMTYPFLGKLHLFKSKTVFILEIDFNKDMPDYGRICDEKKHT